MSLIEAKSDAAVGTITLDHPKRRNALSSQLVDARRSASKAPWPLQVKRGRIR